MKNWKNFRCLKAGAVIMMAILALSFILSGCGQSSGAAAESGTQAADESAAKAAENAIADLLKESAPETPSPEETKAPEEKPEKAVFTEETKAVKETEKEAPEETETKAPEEETKETQGADVSDSASDTAYYGPEPGELEPAIEGGFGAGRTVVFDGAAYLHQPDGIYLLEDYRDPELLVSLTDQNASEICTDGYMLYYCDDGKLMELDLTRRDAEPVRISDKSLEILEGSSVVGAGHHYIYVESFGTVADDMYAGPAEVSVIMAIDRESGEEAAAWEGFFGGCRGGNTWMFAESYDITPGQLMIYDFQGEKIVDEPYAWGVGESQGLLWYSLTEEKSGFSNAVLYKLDVDGPEEILRLEDKNGMYYGISVNGFLATSYFATEPDEDFNTETTVTRIDLRTMKPLEKRLNQKNDDWYAGFSRKGKDFLLRSEQIFRVDKDGLTNIFDLKPDVYRDGIYMTDSHIIVEDIADRIQIFEYDPASGSGVHTIPVTSFTTTRRKTGTEGLMVTENRTAFMTDGAWEWAELYRSLDNWNSEAEARSVKLAEDCYQVAEYLAEEGLFNDHEDPPLKAEIMAYVQRADTNAFCFMEHEWIDPVVGPKNYEVKTGFNFDTKDGHALALDEVVTDLNTLSELMIEDIEKNFPNMVSQMSAPDFVDELLSRRSLVSSRDFSWVLGYEGVSFYFNGSVNFPFTRGAWKFYVGFSEHPEIFERKWMQVPDSYAYDILLDSYYAEDYQIESDLGIETILVTPEKALGEDGLPLNYIDSLRIFTSEGPASKISSREDMQTNVFTDTVSGMILHEGGRGRGKAVVKSAKLSDKKALPRTDGQNYLLVQYNGDSMGLEVFSLDGVPESVCEIGQGALPQYCPENDTDSYGSYVTHSWLSDPDFFTVLTLGEEGVEKGFHVRHFCRLKDGMITER